MKYMLLFYANASQAPHYTAEEGRAARQGWFDLLADMKAAGVYLSNHGLAPVTDATTVRVRNGETVATPGLHLVRVRRGMTAGGKLVAQPVGRHFQELHRGCLLQLRLKNRIEPLELNSRVLGSKAPIDFDLLRVAFRLPRSHLLPKRLFLADPPI